MAIKHLAGVCIILSQSHTIYENGKGGGTMKKSYVSYIILGRHIRAARKRQHLTQEQVAEMMKVSVAHYGRLERGEREISLDRLGEVSIILKSPIEELLSGCVSAAGIIAQSARDSTFAVQMERYSQCCTEETLARMLRICDVLAAEDMV